MNAADRHIARKKKKNTGQATDISEKEGRRGVSGKGGGRVGVQ